MIRPDIWIIQLHRIPSHKRRKRSQWGDLAYTLLDFQDDEGKIDDAVLALLYLTLDRDGRAWRFRLQQMKRSASARLDGGTAIELHKAIERKSSAALHPRAQKSIPPRKA